MDENGKLLKSYRNGPSNINGMIEDYAFFIWGLIELYQATFDTYYINKALLLSEYQKEYFWDDKEGGFFFTSDIGEKLLIRNKEIYERYGFEVYHEWPNSGKGKTLWFMIRKP